MTQVFLYDTTLRDGTQREDISLSVDDKLIIAQRIADFGFRYIEGGWPGSNPKDAEFFSRAAKLDLGEARLAAFGRTRQKNLTCEQDTNLKALLDAETPVVTMVGKSSAYHAELVLSATLEENLAMIRDSVAYIKSHGREVMFDAEHFFDGFIANREYTLATLQAAAEAGVDWLVLCETNGGKLPWEVEEIVREVRKHIDTPLGVHCHNDTGCGVSNTLAAVRGGCTQVQGTINGYGERVGNANLTTIIPNLQLKMDMPVVKPEQLRELTSLSHFVAEVVNLKRYNHAPYIGHSAFAHKGGIHVAAMIKARDTYQHIDPALVGNEMRSVVSELSGCGNIQLQAKKWGIDVSNEEAQHVLNHIKNLEHEGFNFEAAEASVELMMHRLSPDYVHPFELMDYSVITKRRQSRSLLSEATVKVKIGHEVKSVSAEGNGPINALSTALHTALRDIYPALKAVHLTDYKVRILDSASGTSAKIRVLATFQGGGHVWTTVGASANVIDSSWMAVSDSLEYALVKLEDSLSCPLY
jgi:2-isopropylmalate synthase